MSFSEKFKNLLRQQPDKKDVWPVIVGGFYRSGTSLVRRILDSHSNVHCGPEVKYFRDFYGQYFQDPLEGLRFYSTVRSLGVGEKELLKISGQAFIKIHERAAQDLGKKRWADKNPENVLFLDEWSELLDEKFVFIHCVRNPLDIFASVKEAEFPLTIPAGMSERVALYRLFVEKGLAFERKNTTRSIRVRYEDLIAEPELILRGMAEKIGEKYERGMMEFHLAKHQEGLEDPKIRFEEGFHRRSLGRWRASLSGGEVKMITDQCKDLFEELGYSVPVSF